MSFTGSIKNIFKNPTVRKIEKAKDSDVLHSLKLGLALSGGGTHGVAYIGVFKAFEEAGIKFDYIAGTSIGSLMGALYSAGIPLSDIEYRALNLKSKDIMTNKIPFMPSKPDKMIEQTRQALEGKGFKDLKIPLTIVAVDIISGEEVHITSGDLATAITASCAVPAIFDRVCDDVRAITDNRLITWREADREHHRVDRDRDAERPNQQAVVAAARQCLGRDARDRKV